MKVICINNKDWENELTIGKVYDVIEEEINLYRVLTDYKTIEGFFKKRFKVIEEPKEEKTMATVSKIQMLTALLENPNRKALIVGHEDEHYLAFKNSVLMCHTKDGSAYSDFLFTDSDERLFEIIEPEPVLVEFKEAYKAYHKNNKKLISCTGESYQFARKHLWNATDEEIDGMWEIL